MKYLTIALSILFGLLGLGLLFSLLGGQYLTAAELPLQEAVSEPCEAAAPLLETARTQWEARRPFFRCLLSHADLDEIDRGFARLDAAAEAADWSSFRQDGAELLARLEALRSADGPRFDTILFSLPSFFEKNA